MKAVAEPKNRLNGKHKATEEVAEVSLKPLDIKEMSIRIVGTSPLITHKFSDKARTSISDKQSGKARVTKQPRNPDEEYRAACYVMPNSPAKAGEPGCIYGIPAAGFKKICMKVAPRFKLGMTGTFVAGAMHVIDDGGGLVRLNFDSMNMREDAVRLQGPSKPLDLRYRPEFHNWSCVLRIRYDANDITASQIVQMLQQGGFKVGWGELRIEKGYSNGAFDVATA